MMERRCMSGTKSSAVADMLMAGVVATGATGRAARSGETTRPAAEEQSARQAVRRIMAALDTFCGFQATVAEICV